MNLFASPDTLSFYTITLHLNYCELKADVRIFSTKEKDATVFHILAKK